MLVTSDVSRIASLLKITCGAVVAYPTETFYGLGARIMDRHATARIIECKGRDAAKGMIILACDMEMVASVAVIDDRSRALLDRFWPGALSVVLRAQPGLDPILAPQGSVAVRISPHPLALALTGDVGPITSTSANISGSTPARTVEEVLAYALAIDGVLDGGQTPGGKPSTLIDLTVWPPVCLREGVIPFDTITP